jgi:hypothetical protein
MQEKCLFLLGSSLGGSGLLGGSNGLGRLLHRNLRGGGVGDNVGDLGHFPLGANVCAELQEEEEMKREKSRKIRRSKSKT